MTFDELLSRIKSTFKSYNSVGLIDDISVYEWYVESLKKFGALPFELYEEIVEIKNGQGKLPEGFRKLIVALKCEPFTYRTEHKKHLQDARFWVERHEKSFLWDSCDECCVTEGEKHIVEKLYYNEHVCTYFYKNPILLNLTDGVNKKMCTTDCANLKIKNSPYEINIIKGKTLQTNFKEGSVFIRYRGFEEDEEGFIVVPETFNGHLEDYITSYVKARLMESIIANGDATGGEQSLYTLYRQDERNSEIKAFTELKAKGFNKESRVAYRNKLRKERKKIETMF